MNKDHLDLSIFCLRARSFLKKGMIEDALGLYNDVIQVDPENAMAYADRGTAYAMLKKFDLALKDIEICFKLGYSEATAYSTAGTIHFELGNFAMALKNFEKSIFLDPDYAFSYYNRANVFHKVGKNDEAVCDLQKCLKLASDNDFKKLIVERLDYISKK